MNSCPYCAQTNTQKDEYGYCKKYGCFYVSGDKEKYNKLKKELSDLSYIPTYKINRFDGIPYNPRKQKEYQILKEIQNLLGFIPLECLK